MPHPPLIDTATLASRLGQPDLLLIDCRFDLARPAWGEDAYAEGHIPSALYAHLDRDLSGPRTGTNGRHPLPEIGALAATLSQWGITDGVEVVAYDQDSGMFASRAWWLLRWVGHDAVSVLDGGLARWVADGHPTRGGAEAARSPRVFVPRPRPHMVASVDEVQASLQDSSVRLVDARAPERFRGDVEPLDPVAGHIPGAANHFFQRNLSGGRFRPPDDLRAMLQATAGGVGADRIISYCGSGVTGCHNLLALEQAGLTGARLYPGSWSEWVADPSRPVARGEE